MSEQAGLAVVRDHLERLSPLAARAVHVHGSLALGGYHHGISDQDVVMLVSTSLTDAHRALIASSHERAGRLLSCAYVLDASVVDEPHPTWTHGWFGERRLSPITRAELHQGLTLLGPPAEECWPAVLDLVAEVVAEVHRVWDHESRRWLLWRKTEYVDLGLTSVARAHLTCATGALVRKDDAIASLSSLGVPRTLCDGVAARRLGYQAPPHNRVVRALSTRREVQRLLRELARAPAD